MAESSPGNTALEAATAASNKMEGLRSKQNSSKTNENTIPGNSGSRDNSKTASSRTRENSKLTSSVGDTRPRPSSSREYTNPDTTRNKTNAQKTSSSPKILFLKRKIKKIHITAEKERTSVCGKATCKNIKLFVVIYALLFMLRGALRHFMFNILEHLQRHFTIRTSNLELIVGVEKIGFAITLMFVAYYGNKMHKPIAIFVGAMFCACGTFICVIPYILEEVRTHGLVNQSSIESGTIPLYFEAGLCQVGRNSSSTSVTQCEALTIHSNRTESFSTLSIGSFGIGIGSSFLITLGFVYIEENVGRNTAPLYYGIVLCLNGIGELFGQVAAWQLTAIDKDLSGRLALSEWDVGAWWLGFALLAALFFILPFPLLFFPKWICEPAWLISRRKRKIEQMLKLIQKEKKAIRYLERKRLRKLKKMKRDNEKNKRRVERHDSFSGMAAEGSTSSMVEAAQINPAFEGSDHEGEGTPSNGNVIDDTTAANGHILNNINCKNGDTTGGIIASNGGVIEDEDLVVGNGTTSLGIVNNSDADDSDDADGNPEASDKDSESDIPQGSDIDIHGRANDIVDPDDSQQDQRHVRFETGGERLTETEHHGMDLEELLQSEEPPRNSSPDDTGSVKSGMSTTADKVRHQLGRRLQDLPKNLWFLINRPVFILTVVGSLVGAYSFAGYHPTLPIYMGAQFPMYDPPNYITGGLPHSVGLILGTLISGCVLQRLPVKVVAHIKVIVILQAVVTCLFLLKLAVTCDSKHFFDTPKLHNETFSMIGECNRRCDCSEVQYEPVCNRGGIIFPSACHAGCRRVRLNDIHNSLLYDQCTCLVDLELSSAFCNSGCTGQMVGYAVLVFLSSLCQGLGLVSLLTIILRCIAEKLRSLALGFAVWIAFLGAFVPGHAVYKGFHNLSCLVFRETCLEDNQCWHVDSSLYRYLQNGATAAFQFLSFIFFLSALLVVRHKAKTAAKVTDSNENTDKGATTRNIQTSDKENTDNDANKNVSRNQSQGHIEGQGHTHPHTSNL